jgi:benzodiazapine receptor
VKSSLSGLTTANSIDTWYTTLEKPFFNPPNWIFGPVWTLLYILMGYAAGRVWSSTATDGFKRSALTAYVVQLLLNAAWSILFFTLQAPLVALVEMLLLWATILWCLRWFKQVDGVAWKLLVPYLMWVSFAAVLNGAIVLLN